MLKNIKNSLVSKKLISLNSHFLEMIQLYESGSFPSVSLLSGEKGIGKFTLIIHFLNYIYSKKEITNYNVEQNLINTNSFFYNSILNNSNSEVLFIKAEAGKNIKIEDIRNLKLILSKSSLSKEPRFIIIDEVEFFNDNSANALLKTLEDPGKNNYFILINNKQADLIKTISSRCLKKNIFLNKEQKKKIIDFLIVDKKITPLIDDIKDLSPGLFLLYNEFLNKYKIDSDENIYFKISKLLHAYKKEKNKALVNLSFLLIDQFFYQLVGTDRNKTFFLLNLKSSIMNYINDFILYNLNLSSVLNSIELKLKDAR